MSYFIHRLISGDPGDAPSISVLDRGFQLGDGVFDTMISLSGKPLLIDPHLHRLIRHAAAIGIEADRTAIRQVVEDVAAATGESHAVIRTTLTRGQAARGLWPAEPAQPSLLVTAQPWPAAMAGRSASLCSGQIPRNQYSPLARIKSLAYLDNILIARHAAETGADDALIHNLDGNAVCTTIANIFALAGERLLTPPLSDGCLDGVMRALVLEEARAMGLSCEETSLTPQVIAEADGLFLTNSVRFIRPVSGIDGRTFADTGLARSLFERLLRRAELETGIHLDLEPQFAGK